MSVSTRSTSLRRPGLLALVLAVVLSPLAVLAAPAQAVPSTGLVISEVFGANAAAAAYNQDYVEIYNPTASAISLAGKSVQYRAATGTAASSKVDLPAILVPAGGHFLVGGASTTATTAATITPDATNTAMNLSGTAGVIVLANSQTLLALPAATDPSTFPAAVIDLVGYGTTATLYENSKAPAPTTTGSPAKPVLNRAGSGATDTDNNGNDFTTAATGTPQVCDCVAPTTLKITEVYTEGGTAGAAYDHDYVELQNTSGSTLNMTGLTLQYRAPGATGTATKVLDLTGSMAANSYDIVQLGTDGVDGAAVPFDAGYDRSSTGPNLGSAGGTLFVAKTASGYDPGTGAVTADQFRSDLIGWGNSNTFETAVADSSSIDPTTALTRLAGGADTDDNSADFNVLTTTANAAPAIPQKTVAEIQGTGDTTPMPGALVTTQGVVTAAYGTGATDFKGFYVQTGGPDLTPDASDALFVFMGSKTSPAVGTSVSVTGRVSEFSGMTELTPSTTGDVTTLGSALPPVVPGTRLPGTGCTAAAADCLTGAALAAAREKHEGELFQPADPYTVTDGYDGSPWANSGSSNFGDIGLAANSTKPLYLSFDLVNPRDDLAAFNANEAYNEAHAITLSDAQSGTLSTAAAFPWMTKDYTVRVGAAVTFPQPVVFDYRNGAWNLQPINPVTAGSTGESQVAIAQNRPTAPDDVLGSTGNVKIATFNMLNYFVHDAQSWAGIPNDASGTGRHCTYYTERTGSTSPGNRVTANNCSWTDTRGVVAPATPVVDGGLGPRGAAQKCDCSDLTNPNADFERQQAKEILAINTMDADVMSLEEVENPIKLGYGGVTPTAADRDIAVAHLVDVLNQAWSADHGGEDTVTNPRWAFVPSPRPEAQPTIAEQDAIRSAFIYNPRKIETVGRSEILTNAASFRNAREPLAQAFKRVGGNRDDGFIVIVNHLKSKSAPADPTTVVGTDNDDAGKGSGYYNGDRVRQARALDAFADSVSEDKHVPAVFMTGDYNAYSHEDPVQALEDAGWNNVEPQNGESSYSFAGLSGSLDHVFANDAALGMVSGQTIWPINANEPVYYEYSRYNYDLTQFYDGTVPFRASDHNPEIIGVNAPVNPPLDDVDTVQVLASNDFHGRILDDPASAAAGAASMAGAVKDLRADNPDTLFAMAGDIIGGSTFESFIAKDKPTIDAMNEAGLDVSSAGNHEFDKGYRDLLDRVMKPYDATDNKYGGANWPYLAANVRLKSDGSYALKSDRSDHGYDHSNGATWWKQLPDGHTVGFIGAVTEDLPSLVAPSSLTEVDITPIVAEVNAAANQLKSSGGCGSPEGCDLVIELVHEGAATPALSALTDGSKFAQIVNGANANIDAIVSGHTHLKYNHKLPVAAWAGRAVTERPVVSAGQYGSYLNQLEFDFQPGTDNLLDVRQHVLAMKDYDADPATQDIVDNAVDNANVQGQVSLGNETGPFQRARRQDPATSTVVENRGGESTLGNLVAEIQRWKTGAQIGFMNPGGLRADLMGSGSYPSSITYRQAADVQPFANTLMTADLTGAQIKTVLEQQWQRDPDNNIPSRPFLRLGTSKGFQFSSDASRAEGDRITGMWLDGEPIDPATTYQVSATNFLFEGGDNFRGLIAGAQKQDTGFSDLQATVDYLEAHPTVSPDFAQHAVDLAVTSTTPVDGYAAGDTVTLDVASLAMTGDQVQADTQDGTVRVYDGSTPVGPAATVDNTLRGLPDDQAGSAHVTFTVPAGVTGPTTTFVLKGNQSGTEFPITIPTRDNRTPTTVSAGDATLSYGESEDLAITVAPAAATGTVTVKEGSSTLGTAALTGGAATYTLAAGSLEPGDHTLTLAYGGDATYGPSTSTVDVTVAKATPTVDATASPATVDPGETSSVEVQVSAAGFTPTGTVTCSAAGMTDVVETLDGDGEASCTVGPWSTAGDRTVTVTYGGDGHATSASTTETVSVDQVDPTVSGLASPTTVTQGTGTSEVTVTVASAGATPTGTVTCDDGTPADVTLASGTATCTVGPFATTGPQTVTITYAGDANTTSGSTTVAINVTPPGGGGDPTPVDTTVSAQADPIVWGDAGSVHVKVTSSKDTTGTVTLSDGGTTIGTASVSTTGTADVVIPAKALTVGSHPLTVRYAGDANNNASTGSVTVEVRKAASTTSLSLSRDSVTVHQGKVTATAQVGSSAGIPTGSVVFSVDGVVVATTSIGAGGIASAQVGPFDTVGTRNVTARYTGDDSTTVSQASALVTATRATPKMSVDRSPSKVVQKKTHVVLDVELSAPGQTVDGDVKVTGAPGGAIVKTLSDGTVRFRLDPFKNTGKVTLTVTYLGSEDNQKVTKQVSFKVVKKG